MTGVQLSRAPGGTFDLLTYILTALEPQLRGSLFPSDEASYDEVRTMNAMINRRPGVHCRAPSGPTRPGLCGWACGNNYAASDDENRIDPDNAFGQNQNATAKARRPKAAGRRSNKRAEPARR